MDCLARRYYLGRPPGRAVATGRAWPARPGGSVRVVSRRCIPAVRHELGDGDSCRASVADDVGGLSDSALEGCKRVARAGCCVLRGYVLVRRAACDLRRPGLASLDTCRRPPYACLARIPRRRPDIRQEA